MKSFDLKSIFSFSGKTAGLIKRWCGCFTFPDGNGDFFADSSHVLKRETGSKYHFLYLIFLGSCIASALWQHGDAVFTLTVLFLLIPAGFFVYVPYRFSCVLLRKTLACLIFFISCFWMVHRLKHNIPADLVFVEGIVIFSFAFLLNCMAKDYNYLFCIGLLLLIYAGLIPRVPLLFLIPGAAAIVLLLQSGERKKHLAGTRELIFLRRASPWRELGRIWHLFLIQILIALPLFIFIFSALPLRDTGKRGLVEVSFHTSRQSAMPQDLKKWLFQDRRFASNKTASRLLSGDNPDTPDQTGKKKMSSAEPGVEFGNGRGAPPGKELLFTAMMPVKLYHLAMLYDVYNGKTWHASAQMRSVRIISKKSNLYYPLAIESKYSIRKWVSPVLYAPFRVKEFYRDIPPGEMALTASNDYHFRTKSFFNIVLNTKNGYPKVPWNYLISSEIIIPRKPQQRDARQAASGTADPEIYHSAAEFFAQKTEKERLRREKLRIAAEKLAQKKAAQKKAAERRAALRKAARKKNTAMSGKQKSVRKVIKKAAVRKKAKVPIKKRVAGRPRVIRDPAWIESLPQKHYLQLPEQLSPKIAELAKQITKDLYTPYEKAVALRDYLRTNYNYKLFADPVPAGKESVAYFLFELKEGHCEYFAASLTILARSLGLPARVATGFSPGNYNALTGELEVYEYHAHAWTQIFIENAGWLTFDAVPPGNIVSETTPVGIGRFRDPFGEDWKIMPPELSEKTLEHVRKVLKEEAERKAQAMLQNQKELEERRKRGMVAASQKKETKQKMPKSLQPVKQVKPAGFKSRMQTQINLLKQKIRSAAACILSRNNRFFTVLLITGICLLFFARKIMISIRMLIDHLRFRYWIRRAVILQKTAPEQSVFCLYRALRLRLSIAGMDRKNNQELIAYAAETENWIFRKLQRKSRFQKTVPTGQELQEQSRLFSQGVKTVFIAFYSLEYGHCSCTETEAEKIFDLVQKIDHILIQLHPVRRLAAKNMGLLQK